MVVAGRAFLKIINVGHDTLNESQLFLRIQGLDRKGFIPTEVKWGNSSTRDVIVTAAATNGSIALYKDFRHDRTLQEHHRQVNRLAFNSADGRLLLSASQDGSVKLWDLREKKSRCTFQGKSDAVRDVQFNAANAVEFVAAYENGTIQRWDYRNPQVCERKISSAHQGPVYCVAWHPDGRHCASGGRDKTVKVWDFNADPRWKSRHTVFTQTSVGRVAWRPRGVRTTELATCSTGNDYRIHMWDLKRPYMPTYVLAEHSNTITGLQFKDEDILWSGGRDGLLMQHDVAFGHQPITDLPQVAFAWSSENEFTIAIQKRKRIEKFGGGLRVHHDQDDFQLHSRGKRKEGRSSSFKSNKGGVQMSALEGSLEKFQPSQATARVHLPVFNFDKFEFLARHYVTSLLDGRGLSIGKACERNSRAAMHVGEFRTAKTWQALGYLLTREEKLMAEKVELERLQKSQEVYATAVGCAPGGGAFVARRLFGLSGAQYVNPGATPLVRPVPDTPKPTPIPVPGRIEDGISIGEALLSPPAATASGLGSVPSSTASTDGDSSPRRLADDDDEAGEYLTTGECQEGEKDTDEIGLNQLVSSPRPILQPETGTGYYRQNTHRRDSNAGITSLDSSSAALFSTSGEDILEGVRPVGDHPGSVGSYEQQIRMRPRQYSIGLMSEQTSDSYEERLLGLGSEREDNGDEPGGKGPAGVGSGSLPLHAIIEEREWNLNSNNQNQNRLTNYDSFNGNALNVNNYHTNVRLAGYGAAGGVGGGGGGGGGGNLNLNSNMHPLHHAANSASMQDLGSSRIPRNILSANPAASNFSTHPTLTLNGQPHPPTPFISTPLSSANRSTPLTPHDSSIPPWSLRHLLPQLLNYYTISGDVQFLATLTNLLNLPRRYPGIAAKRQIDEWVEGYVQLLRQKELRKVAAEVVKWTPSGLVKRRGQTDTFIIAGCGWCGRAILGGNPVAEQAEPHGLSDNGGRGGGRGGNKSGYWYCDHCRRTQDGCVLCRKAVRGRWVMCFICGHGGHEGCLREWFFGITDQTVKKVRKNRHHNDYHHHQDQYHHHHHNGGINPLMATSTTDTNMKSKILDRQGGGVRDGVVGKGGVGNGTGSNGSSRSPSGGGTTEYSDSDVDEADYEPMDTCPAFGCGHECLPIFLA